jgi:probable HAF family extracellular repeat protein
VIEETRKGAGEPVKLRILSYIAALTLFVVPLASSSLAAQDGSKLSSAPRQYTVQLLSGLGGLGGAFSINDLSWASGVSEPPDDPYDRAFLWRNGQITDLGTLGGYNSAIPFPNKNEIGWFAGISETADNDPYQENFCQFTCSSASGNCLPFNQVCKGFLWRPGKEDLIPLPPLPGGNNSYGFDANNRQQIVGAAENGVTDSTCGAPQVFDYEAVVWRLGPNGTPFISQQLPPIAGDAVSAATQINDQGDAVGASGPCTSIGLGVGAHAVLWHAGRALDLGSLGGVTNNVAFAINSQEQVVGISDLSGDNVAHAFLWENGAMQDLGTLRSDDTFALAESINDRGEVVGFSCGPIDCRGFHWQAGVMTDLNSVLPANSPLLITNAADINSLGEIAVQAYDSTVGDLAAAVLSPVGNAIGSVDGVAETRNVERKIILPENVRKTLRDRIHRGHF